MARELLLEAISPGFPSSPKSNSAHHKISFGVLLTIIILAMVFFLLGLLYLILRCMIIPSNRETAEVRDNVSTSLRRQLQHLFHLHDSGLDQSFIDSLPVFLFKSINGPKNPFDCAVCLCEFQPDDKLRLLPRCSHAFHLHCIDTWLLSHSSCPLCRGNLLHLDCLSSNFSPFVVVLESSSENESSGELVGDDIDADQPASTSNTQPSLVREEENVSKSSGFNFEIATRLAPVKLSKFRNIARAAITDGSSIDGTVVDGVRRCRSTGSFGYVADNSSMLNVAIQSATAKKHPIIIKCQHPSHSIKWVDGFEAIDSHSTSTSSAQVKHVGMNDTLIQKSWRSLSLKLPLRSNDEDASRGPHEPSFVGAKSWMSYSWNWRSK